MNKHIDHFITSAINWVFRVKSTPAILLKAGMTLLTLSLISGYAFKVKVPFKNGEFIFDYDSSGFTPAIITYSVFFLGIVVVIIGMVLYCHSYNTISNKNRSNKLISIETRGLRDGVGEPLCKYIPNPEKFEIKEIICDLRQKFEDGFIINPEKAITKIARLPERLDEIIELHSRENVELFFGGLTPVPLNFLTGVMLDDEYKITIMDWDRHKNDWKILNADDDGERYSISGFEGIRSDDTEILLVISTSYLINENFVKNQFTNIKVVSMKLSVVNVENCWSEIKQVELGKQFINTLIKINGLGINKIHLFMASPNSLTFRFGRLYDKRNLPELVVYQFEKTTDLYYPWGVSMPVGSKKEPTIISA